MENPLPDRVRVTGRLWFETEGSGLTVPYFKRTRWETVEIEVPAELAPKQPREDQMSILTEAGETYEPDQPLI